MSDVKRLTALGMPYIQAEEIAKQIDAAGGGGDPVTSDDVTVSAITADNFTFAGGTLTEFCQAIADAIPAA